MRNIVNINIEHFSHTLATIHTQAKDTIMTKKELLSVCTYVPNDCFNRFDC